MAAIRRLILLSLAFALGNATAASISLEKSTPEGRLQNAFTQEDGKWFFVQNTNYFDQTESVLGKREVSNPEAFAKAVAQLEQLEQALDKADKILPPSKEDRPAGAERAEHYKVGGRLIHAQHPYFKQAQDIFEAMRFNGKLEKLTGTRIDLSQQATKAEFKAGKKINEEVFNMNFHCRDQESLRACEIQGMGLLFLKRP